LIWAWWSPLARRRARSGQRCKLKTHRHAEARPGAYLFTLVFDHGRSGWRVAPLTADGKLTAVQYEVFEGPGGG
jgi:hypothetical protein